MTSQGIEKWFRRLLPSPFSMALILTILTFVLAYYFGQFSTQDSRFVFILKSWKTGFWNPSLMRFLVQMMLMLVLGHILALSPIVKRWIDVLLRGIDSSGKAVLLISFSSILLGLFNWGLALIGSAILARKIAEHAKKQQFKINYPLIVAAAYASLMVWHGGISGSAPAKVAEPGHIKQLMSHLMSPEQLTQLPDVIDYGETIFSKMNGFVCLALLIFLPSLLYFINKKTSQSIPDIDFGKELEKQLVETAFGAEKMDSSVWFSRVLGFMILFVAALDLFSWSPSLLQTFTPDWINLVFLGLALLSHQHIKGFLKAAEEAISGSVGILIQFPFYFGIMGMMNASGLVEQMSTLFIQVSTTQSLPLFTFFSAGLVNIFIPSGGGQWAVQGPISIQAAESLKLSYSKLVMALAYGDQLTNMLQPFWALPLLGITKLKASQILPYTLILFLLGLVIYGSALLIF
ncbi:MAG: short-chain fatty acid transporter [Flavobacteriales bacterium]